MWAHGAVLDMRQCWIRTVLYRNTKHGSRFMMLLSLMTGQFSDNSSSTVANTKPGYETWWNELNLVSMEIHFMDHIIYMTIDDHSDRFYHRWMA